MKRKIDRQIYTGEGVLKEDRLGRREIEYMKR